MIDQETIDKLAGLARVHVPIEEKEQVAKDITNIVGFLDTIQKVSIPEMGEKIFEQKNVMRDDTVDALVSAYDLVEAAPLHKDGFVQVPKVIGE